MLYNLTFCRLFPRGIIFFLFRLWHHRNAINAAKASQMRPDEAMINYIYYNLFSKHTNKWNANGEFRNIVSLTHKELVAFYSKFYHPSNGQAFSMVLKTMLTSA